MEIELGKKRSFDFGDIIQCTNSTYMLVENKSEVLVINLVSGIVATRYSNLSDISQVIKDGFNITGASGEIIRIYKQNEVKLVEV